MVRSPILKRLLWLSDGRVRLSIYVLTKTNSYLPLDQLFNSTRNFVTEANKDGSAKTDVVLQCTLRDIARATNLRPDDAAFAMHEIGLLVKMFTTTNEQNPEEVQDHVALTRELVEQIAEAKGVKALPMMGLEYVCLPPVIIVV